MLLFNKIKDINLTLLATDSHNQLKATLMTVQQCLPQRGISNRGVRTGGLLRTVEQLLKDIIFARIGH